MHVFKCSLCTRYTEQRLLLTTETLSPDLIEQLLMAWITLQNLSRCLLSPRPPRSQQHTQFENTAVLSVGLKQARNNALARACRRSSAEPKRSQATHFSRRPLWKSRAGGLGGGGGVIFKYLIATPPTAVTSEEEVDGFNVGRSCRAVNCWRAEGGRAAGPWAAPAAGPGTVWVPSAASPWDHPSTSGPCGLR